MERMGRQINWHAVENFDQFARKLDFRFSGHVKIFGIVVAVGGILACLFAMAAASNQMGGEYGGLPAIAMSIAAVGIVGAAAVILRNSRSN
jgi:hypothetical protein